MRRSCWIARGANGKFEVGHLNIGAGRIVYQELHALMWRYGWIFCEEHYTITSNKFAKNNKKPLHLIGLVSDGGVHSHINHLKELTDICKNEGLKNVLCMPLPMGVIQIRKVVWDLSGICRTT